MIPTESMEELIQNIRLRVDNQPKTPKVCILTAGLGSRMGDLTFTIHKALLPVDKKAVISHIIEKFPKETCFVIALGHLADQVRAYLEMAHPETIFEFVSVDNYDGPGSGPGYSLRCCFEALQDPFYFVACDTMWSGSLPTDQNHNWCAVSPVPIEESAKYCNLQLQEEQVVGMTDKHTVPGADFEAFTGLCFIRSVATFWDGLTPQKASDKERQMTDGLRQLIEHDQVVAKSIEWLDIGDREGYHQAVERYENFNFAKQDEALYILNERVIKIFGDRTISKKRIERASQVPNVFPKIQDERGGVYWYELQPGETLYTSITPPMFSELLSWLKAHLWKPVEVNESEMKERAEEFYRKKTLGRLRKFYDKYPVSRLASSVNSKPIRSVDELLSYLDWNSLCSPVPVFFHGDLQFDNILRCDSTQPFLLLDWRQDFGGTTEWGDIYYDFAKLLGGIRLNYDYIKLDLFSLEEDGSNAWLDRAVRTQADELESILEEFVVSNGYDWKKVRTLTALIYLNMSPLHHHPFDRFLYYLGSSYLEREFESDDQQKH